MSNDGYFDDIDPNTIWDESMNYADESDYDNTYYTDEYYDDGYDDEGYYYYTPFYDDMTDEEWEEYQRALNLDILYADVLPFPPYVFDPNNYIPF